VVVLLVIGVARTTGPVGGSPGGTGTATELAGVPSAPGALGHYVLTFWGVSNRQRNPPQPGTGIVCPRGGPLPARIGVNPARTSARLCPAETRIGGWWGWVAPEDGGLGTLHFSPVAREV
jgi:hypothetical protein